ncbi:alpha/beta-hydrolase [Cryphonectria parasitica EP155]|uniref:Alpha/beta-hydrolase n=1 Tax=Cryphonectria parasitica (strain ATCC 38755 / EP155) TaxID=660469 RepID=A0A9P4Y3R1_CRYP1|nr:alpha/beta-hydrolase [Cryphonectria parasitica EP155]KAF3766389.1 alpha/beta-hydrolase [Cryphonectria parasitica EP155]
MAKQNVSIILVPGSFATPPLYNPLLDTLHSQGFNAQAINLPSANDGSVLPAPTAADDAAHIRQAILSLLDDSAHAQNVVLALHSYAGIPGSTAVRGLSRADRAAQGKSTAVVGVVYIASFVLPLGRSLRAFMSSMDAMPEGPARDGVPGGYMPALEEEAIPWAFSDVEDEEARWRWAGMMTAHSSDSYDGPVEYEAWKEIPSVQIIPENDVVCPTHVQEKMHEGARAAGGVIRRVFLKGVGHMLVLTQPELVAGEIVKMAGEEAV